MVVTIVGWNTSNRLPCGSMTDPRILANNTLTLVNEIYRSILQPEQFVEVLELWDSNISFQDEEGYAVLDALEAHLTTVIPLLETSLKSVINEDELINRLAGMDRPGLLVTGNGMVVGANEQGRHQFGLGTGDMLNFDKFQVSAARELKRIMTHSRSCSDEDLFSVINFDCGERDFGPAGNLAACRSISVEGSKTGYVLINSMNLVFSEAGAAAFKSAFGLTDAEMRILSHLVAGRRQVEIAVLDNIREDTVKKHISAIRAKTAAPNTTALVCLAAGFAQIPADQGRVSCRDTADTNTITNSSGQTYTKPGWHKVIRIDGRRIEYVDEGPRNGEPLLICHSSMVGYVLPPEFIQGLTSAGYRVIVPFRPRCGLSDPLDPDFSLEKTALHLMRFAEAIGVKRFSCVAGTAGMCYAMAMAALQPDRVKCVIGIAGYLPIDRAELHRSMARYQRAILYTQLRSRTLAKFLVLSGYKMYLQLGSHKFLSQIMRHSKADLRVLENADSLGVLSLGLRIGGAQGVDALLDDTSLILMDWTELVNAVECQVYLLHGNEDSMFHEGGIKRFIDGRENFQMTVLPGRGQLMIYDDPIQIVSLLLDRLPAPFSRRGKLAAE